MVYPTCITLHLSDYSDIVTFQNTELKDHTEANLRNLKHTVDKFKGVGISKDLNPKERQEIKDFISDAKNEHCANSSESAENFRFLVVGKGQRRKVIKIKKNNSIIKSQLNRKSHTLHCIYLNARSLANKFDQFLAEVYAVHPDIIGVTESWTNAEINDAEISLPGYILFRCDRPIVNKGGGVLLYVQACLNPVCFIPKTKYPEHVWCKLNTVQNTELIVGVCYRSTNLEIFDYDLHSALCNLISVVVNMCCLWGISIIPVSIGIYMTFIQEDQRRLRDFLSILMIAS